MTDASGNAQADGPAGPADGPGGRGRLVGRTALVIGAGSSGPGWGNGKAAAVLFAREGARVIAVDRALGAAEETAAIIQAEGGTAIAVAADVTDTDSLTAVRDRADRDGWAIDLLHNNVGIATVGGPAELAETDWERTLSINLGGVYRAAHVFLDRLEASGRGAIVTVGSIAGNQWLGFGYAAYAASKAGLVGLTRNMAIEYARRGVRANLISPGLMDTPMVRGQLTGAYGGDEAAMLARRHAQVPMGRMGDAWDVAMAAVFLASEEARYITGQELVVDGGVSLAIPGSLPPAP